MIKNISIRRLLAGSLLPALLGLPFPTVAAMPTPQQTLNEALKNEMTRQAGRMDMTMRFDMSNRPYKNSEPTTKGSVVLRFQARTLPAPNGEVATLKNSQGEGRLVVESADLQGIPKANLPIKLDGPLAFQWKLSDGKMYTRLERVPQSLLDLMKSEMKTDLGTILGRWVMFDLGGEELAGVPIARDSAFDLIKQLSNGDLARELRLKAFFARTSVLQVTRVEKRMKNTAGEDVWRLRVRLNPAVVNFIYREALRDLPKSGTDRTTKLRELNAEFVKLRTQLSRTSMAVNVNVSKKRIERIEFAGRYPEVAKDCTYDANLRERCKNVGTNTYTVAVGISMSHDAGEAIEVPLDVLTPEQAGNILFPSLSTQNEPTPVGDLSLNDNSTLVAGGATLPAVDVTRDHILGSNSATVSLTVYSDFQCPYCASFDSTLRQVLDAYPVNLRLVYRHFPLSSIHPEAQKAAEASECAAKLGGNDAFWRMHDKLFAGQAILGNDAYLSFAQQVGLDEGAFTTCLNSGEMASRVKEDADTAVTLGLQGTPTSFMNNAKIEGALPFSIMSDEAYAAGARQ